MQIITEAFRSLQMFGRADEIGYCHYAPVYAFIGTFGPVGKRNSVVSFAE
jgi:hypothetical protein